MKRDLNLDTLKGFLTILVVYGHISYGLFSIEKLQFLSRISSFIYFFHMPIFLATSAIFIKGNYTYLIKRASLILLPYAFWFSYEHKMMFFENTGVFFAKLFMGNWHSTESIIWFLPTLFSLNFLIYLFIKGQTFLKIILLFSSISTFIFSSKIAIIHNYIPFGIDVALYLFILTYLIKVTYQHKHYILNIAYYPMIIIMILTSTFLLFTFEPIKTLSRFHARVDLAQFSVPVTIIGYMSFIVLSISIFIFFMKVRSSKKLAFVGRYSFPIFLMHLTVLYKLPELIKFDNLILKLLLMIITFVLSILIPIIVSRILMTISDKFKYIGLSK
ncbi:MAG: acyltransferase family protein [Lutibacter sp.]|nr:acyltransferase family protein [Lutibacter sp.]